MTHEKAMDVAQEVTEVIKPLDHLYCSIIIKENGNRQVVIRVKGDTQK